MSKRREKKSIEELSKENEQLRADLEELRRQRAAWLGKHKAVPKREDVTFDSLSGRELQPLYTPIDNGVYDPEYLEKLSLPGEYPFTRGPYTTMYRTRLWTMRQFSGFGTAEETNERYKYLLEHGQTGLSVAFDFPTLMGYDSDDPRSEGEVGVCGVAISSLADMERLFEGIPLGDVSVSMTINGPAMMLYCFLLATAEKQGVDLKEFRGTIQNDILKEYMAQHAWIFPPEPALKIIADIFEWSSKHAPKFNTISISGYHIREAGSTAVQELAFTLKNGFTYVEKGIERGLDVDEFAPRLSFFWDVHNDFFEEVAKFRAARRIWARHMKEIYGAKNPESWRLRTHAQTAGVSLMAQQPENNIARVAYQAMAAVLGGTQSLHTNALDETLALPTEKSVRIALRTQQILAYETGVAHTIDPLAGSYYVEWLTDQMEADAERIFEEIDELGGVVRGIEEGYFQGQIAHSAERFQQEVESDQRIIVAVNEFTGGNDDVSIDLLKIGREIQEKQGKRLAELRATRDSERVEAALDRLTRAAQEDENLMGPMLDAARAYATLGEIRHALEKVYGRFREPIFF
ncbi:MAG: methylmalonyl-CoA mutase family protein [Gemmatimonadetes bacterium]|uniref:Methylmalonyl-CoA mutase family protein n=1 Tax=Candidatus Kutchimonas denitrificans TaxID=3056748 RepID=A0AAE5CBM8_9BACT|nr:methylmalonyl-CoA mutase family protein [Gemmatimonadota bacterium]NIR74625.1 methylmalonyl-CoA mutase family protein [Candidatus Kutchimonas denitrificans]NIS02815.1 methylmalonyl-CoA mutase family protein [Gemmatimonadota bacterium]NIT68976.1 methylmalonyl-CoA mutase family protein [Gemmatimonadota bacterium]NIU52281.1 methylmalonyl-CoA mutase [Gemmatimonadota bacterium]